MQRERLKRLAATIDRALSDMHNSGKLQWFNAAFAAARCKNPALNYRRARIQLRNLIMRKLILRQPLDAKTLAAETFAAQINKTASGFDKTDRADTR
jgi:hypothetical protein